MELRMKKDEGYVLTAEERQNLKTEIMDLLVEYDYNPTEYAVDKILNEWAKNKGWMINLFKKHPNYNGKYQIAFDADYERVCNKRIIFDFCNYFLNVARELLKQEVKINNVYTYDEMLRIYNRLSKVVYYMEEIEYFGYHVEANGRNWEETLKEYKSWQDKVGKIQDNPEYYISDNAVYNKEKWLLCDHAERFAEKVLSRHFDSVATEDIASFINSLFPTVKAVAGQKISRIVNKVCKVLGIDKDANYNREFAKYSDAINPLSINRHTIISCHPVDYLTMSFGNSWASCHTIDKENKRNMPDNYHGCYSSGTISYMLDTSSWVFYTVDKEYNGNTYELEDKINRNMFHMGEDKLIQARVYPQSTDGANGIYRQIREIAQKVIADCLEVPNMWKNVKGSSACYDMINSKGTHYRDYSNFADCNVSYLKGDTDEVNAHKIIVGHAPICINCGCEHGDEECIECEDCDDSNTTCASCGAIHNRYDMHYIDGNYYCDDCCFYCDYHEQTEAGDCTYVSDYGNVCEHALNDDNFQRCDRCGSYYYNISGVATEDGNWYCSEYCARKDGYEETSDGRWYLEDEIYYCEHCGTSVQQDDWNSELDCCSGCEDEVLAERESEEE